MNKEENIGTTNTADCWLQKDTLIGSQGQHQNVDLLLNAIKWDFPRLLGKQGGLVPSCFIIDVWVTKSYIYGWAREIRELFQTWYLVEGQAAAFLSTKSLHFLTEDLIRTSTFWSQFLLMTSTKSSRSYFYLFIKQIIQPAKTMRFYIHI